MKTVSEVQKEEEFRKWADGYCLEIVLSAYSPPEDLFTFISKILKNAMSYARQKTKEEEQKMSKSVEKRPTIQKEEEEEFKAWYQGRYLSWKNNEDLVWKAWLERGQREEASRQKMREEMERLEVECDNQSSTIEMYQITLKECEEKVSQVESKSEELQKSFEAAIDGYGKAAEKVEQLESELASLNGHCLIMYQEGQHEHDLMEEWHQKALKLEKWQERSMKDYLNLHVKYKQLESELACLRSESLESTLTEDEKFERWWTRDGYHLDEGRFKETMKHVWLTARKEMREEIDKLNQVIEQAEEMEKEAQEKVNQVESELERLKESMIRHFQEEHLQGDGPEIDRWKLKVGQLESELTQMKEILGKCVECETYTCGYCGMHNSKGEWRCNACHRGETSMKNRISQLESELVRFHKEHAEVVDEISGWGPDDGIVTVIRRMKAKIEDLAREVARLRGESPDAGGISLAISDGCGDGCVEHVPDLAKNRRS